MNTDCFTTIVEFAGPKTATRLTREFTEKFLPKSITIVGHKQMEEFYRWADHFDTSNLTEVRMVIQHEKIIESLRTHYPTAKRADGLVVASPIGMVPPSVKKLTLCVYTCEPIQISDTVEELVIESCGHYQGVMIPDSVRTLHLMDGFSGVISHWPANLENLTMNGWCLGNGRWPVPIEYIPDTVKHMVVGSHLDIEILYWPDSLETLVFEGNPENYGWFVENAGIPDWVEVRIQTDAPEEEEEEFTYDDYEDPMVEMWNL